MSCNRCYDIHEAQKLGKTQESCKCHCHDNNTWSTIPTITWTNHTTAGSPTFTCNIAGNYGDYSAYTPTCDCDTQPCEKVHRVDN